MQLKVFAREAVIYAAGNIGLRAASLLLTPVYTFWLSMEEFGLWAFLQTTIQLMVVVMGLGMAETVVRFTRECANCGATRHLIGTSMAWVGTGAALVSLLAWLIMPGVLGLLSSEENTGRLVALSCAVAVCQTLSILVLSYYRATNQPKRYMRWGLTAAGLLLASTVVVLCVMRAGVLGILWGHLFTYGVILCCLVLNVCRQTGIAISRQMALPFLRYGAPLVVSMGGHLIISGAGVYALGIFMGLETVGVYSLGYKLAAAMSITLMLPFQLAFQPFLYGNLGEPQVRDAAARIFTYLVIVTTVITGVLLVTARLLLPVIAPPQYADSLTVLILLLPAQALVGVRYFGETLIGAVNRTGILATLNTAAAIVCIGLNVLLIPRMGWWGAALATSLTVVFIDCCEVAIGLKLFRLEQHVEWSRVAAVAAAFSLMLSVAFLLRHDSALIFSLGTCGVLAAAAAAARFAQFWTPRELSAVRGALSRVGTLLNSWNT